jgi:hypothetical protein
MSHFSASHILLAWKAILKMDAWKNNKENTGRQAPSVAWQYYDYDMHGTVIVEAIQKQLVSS